MKKVLVCIGTAILILTANLSAAQDAPTYDSLLKTAVEGFEAEDWSKVATALDAAQEFRPYSQFITRNRVLAYAMLGDFQRAQSIAEKVADRGLSLPLGGHPGFDALTSRAEFTPVREKMEANLAPKGASDVVAEVEDNSLLPEAFVRSRKNELVGSVRTGKIVRLDGSTLAQAPGGVFSLEPNDKAVWAAVNTAAPYESAAETTSSSLIAFSLSDGAPTATVALANDATLVGDIEATPAGLIASDSVTPRIFLLRKGEARASVFAKDSRFVNLQGLAYDKRRKLIFVADYLVGIFAMDAKTGVVTPVVNTADAHLGGIDGLYLYDGDLVGIQNGTTPQRIVRIGLNKKGDIAESLSVLVQNHPNWREPTNGQIIGDQLQYVATSNWPAYGEDGAIDDSVTREPVRIMSVQLKAER